MVEISQPEAYAHINKDGWYDMFDCFLCEKGVNFNQRKVITARILGEIQALGVCDDCKNHVPAHYLWEKIEDIEHIFFLKRLANPYYGWEQYWIEHYAKKDEQEEEE